MLYVLVRTFFALRMGKGFSLSCIENTTGTATLENVLLFYFRKWTAYLLKYSHVSCDHEELSHLTRFDILLCYIFQRNTVFKFYFKKRVNKKLVTWKFNITLLGKSFLVNLNFLSIEGHKKKSWSLSLGPPSLVQSFLF